jgi:predicted O-methyltransferase YrrM
MPCIGSGGSWQPESMADVGSRAGEQGGDYAKAKLSGLDNFKGINENALERYKFLMNFASDTTFCPTLHEMVQSGRAPAATKTIDTSSMSSVNNMVALRNLHLSLNARETLEVGMRMGGSCLALAQTHKDLGCEPRGQHVAIDPYQRTPFNDSAGLLAIERAGLQGYVDFRETHSALALPRLVSEKRSFDLIYIDGSHNFEDVFVDAYFSALLLSVNGVVALDDSSNPHIRKVLSFIRRNLRHCLEEIDLAPFRRKTSLKYKLVRMIGRINLTAFRRIGDLERAYGYRLRRF